MRNIGNITGISTITFEVNQIMKTGNVVQIFAIFTVNETIPKGSKTVIFSGLPEPAFEQWSELIQHVETSAQSYRVLLQGKNIYIYISKLLCHSARNI